MLTGLERDPLNVNIGIKSHNSTIITPEEKSWAKNMFWFPPVTWQSSAVTHHWNGGLCCGYDPVTISERPKYLSLHKLEGKGGGL